MALSRKFKAGKRSPRATIFDEVGYLSPGVSLTDAKELKNEIHAAIAKGNPGALSKLLAKVGPFIWKQSGFARQSLRGFEQCTSAGGAQCLLLWLSHAKQSRAFPSCLGLSGLARAHAILSVAQAGFWSHESDSAVMPRVIGQIASDCLKSATLAESSDTARRLSCELLGARCGRMRQALLEIAKNARGHGSWVLSVNNNPPAFSVLLKKFGFCACKDILEPAMDELFRAQTVCKNSVALCCAALLDVDGISWAEQAGGFSHADAQNVAFCETVARKLNELPAHKASKILDKLLAALGTAHPAFRFETPKSIAACLCGELRSSLEARFLADSGLSRPKSVKKPKTL